MRPLFPELKVNQQQMLPVSDGHSIYVEESGNPNGIPVVYCHGGPGGGSSPLYRRFYDPEKYRIILFDQRGCGHSTPHCSQDINATWNNTTQHLIADMEVIREHYGISEWVVAGGSWGTTLALLYGIAHPHRVLGFLLRGIFLARQQDVDWLFGDKGAAQLFPEYYQQFINGVPDTSVPELIEHFLELLTGDNDLVQLAAAKQFCQWESRVATLKGGGDSNLSSKEAIAMALLNCHYFNRHAFIYEHEILSEISVIQHIPTFIVHGRYDVVCKAEGAFTLHQALPESALEFVADAGHSCTEPGIIDGLIRASIKLADIVKNN